MTIRWPFSLSTARPHQADDPIPTDDDEPGEVCIANISPRERRRRLYAGLIQLGIGLAMLAVLLATGADRWWRLPLFLIFGGAAAGVLQWREKT